MLQEVPIDRNEIGIHIFPTKSSLKTLKNDRLIHYTPVPLAYGDQHRQRDESTSSEDTEVIHRSYGKPIEEVSQIYGQRPTPRKRSKVDSHSSDQGSKAPPERPPPPTNLPLKIDTTTEDSDSEEDLSRTPSLPSFNFNEFMSERSSVSMVDEKQLEDAAADTTIEDAKAQLMAELMERNGNAVYEKGNDDTTPTATLTKRYMVQEEILPPQMEPVKNEMHLQRRAGSPVIYRRQPVGAPARHRHSVPAEMAYEPREVQPRSDEGSNVVKVQQELYQMKQEMNGDFSQSMERNYAKAPTAKVQESRTISWIQEDHSPVATVVKRYTLPEEPKNAPKRHSVPVCSANVQLELQQKEQKSMAEERKSAPVSTETSPVGEKPKQVLGSPSLRQRGVAAPYQTGSPKFEAVRAPGVVMRRKDTPSPTTPEDEYKSVYAKMIKEIRRNTWAEPNPIREEENEDEDKASEETERSTSMYVQFTQQMKVEQRKKSYYKDPEDIVAVVGFPEDMGETAKVEESKPVEHMSTVDTLRRKLTTELQQQNEALEQLKDDFNADKFLDDVPYHGEKTGLPLPGWKRQQIAEKRAQSAYSLAQAEIMALGQGLGLGPVSVGHTDKGWEKFEKLDCKKIKAAAELNS